MIEMGFIMFRCAWCMKKIAENQPLYAISVKFAEGIDYSEKEGEIQRNRSVQWIFRYGVIEKRGMRS